MKKNSNVFGDGAHHYVVCLLVSFIFVLRMKRGSSVILYNTPNTNTYSCIHHPCESDDSDGESNLVSQNVLVGEEGEQPPTARQALWDI